MSDIEKVLHERGKRYGEYPDHAMITQGIKRAIHSGRSWDSCNPHMQETLDMIAHKIGRIVNGDPYYVDSWTDIVGYARLTEKELLEGAPTQEDAVATISGRVIEEILAFKKTVYDPENTKGANIKLAEAVQLLWRVAAETKNM